MYKDSEIFTFSLTKIKEDAYENLDYKKLIFKNDVTIEFHAFKNCRNLETIEFNSLKNFVSSAAFINCNNLKYIILNINKKQIKIEVDNWNDFYGLYYNKIQFIKNKYVQIIYEIDENGEIDKIFKLYNGENYLNDGLLKPPSEKYKIIDIDRLKNCQIIDLHDIYAEKISISICQSVNKIIFPKSIPSKLSIYNFYPYPKPKELIFNDDIMINIVNLDTVYGENDKYFINYYDGELINCIVFEPNANILYMVDRKLFNNYNFEDSQRIKIELDKLLEIKNNKNINTEELSEIKLILEHFDTNDLINFISYKNNSINQKSEVNKKLMKKFNKNK